MKTLKLTIKTLLFLLIAVNVLGCSKDDDNKSGDPDEAFKLGHATAIIGVDDRTIPFSTKTENSFATVYKTKIGDQQINQLLIVMSDDNSEMLIVTQVAPAPVTPTSYNLSTPLTDTYFFTAGVAVDGKNSSDTNVYTVGTYQNGEDVVTQSKGAFKITSLSPTRLKGTFEMTLYNSYQPKEAHNAKKLEATKGEFDLPIVELTNEQFEDLGLN